MKKFLWLIVSIMLAVSMVSAQSYKELVAKGKEYEKNKEWIYALGCYNDAMQLQDKDEEAQRLYTKLFSTISSGKPGYGEFDMFTLHDEWSSLVKNAEKYFTENIPYTISSGDIKRESIHYENRTASYSGLLKVEETSFFKDIKKVLRDCCENADKDGGLKEIPWIYEKYINIGLTEGSILSFEANYEGLKKPDFYFEKIVKEDYQKYAQAIYKKTGIALSYGDVSYANNLSWTSDIIFEFPAFVVHSVGFMKYSCYRIKLGIYDENDKLLVEAEDTLKLENNEYNYYTFNVTQDKMNIIENKEYKIKLLGIRLYYGYYEGFYEGVSSIQLNTAKVQFSDKHITLEQKRLAEEQRIAEEKAAEKRRIAEQKAAEERRRIEEEQRIAAEKQREKQREKQLEAALDYEIYQAGKFLGIENNSLMNFLKSSVKNTFNGTTLAFEGAFTSRELEIIAIMCKDVDIYLSDFSNVFDWRNSIKEMDNKEVFEEIYIGNISHKNRECGNTNGIICSGNIKTLDLSKTSIEIIPKGVFARTNIESIILPESLTKVEDDAFYDCSNLKTVKFNGTEKQWKKVKIKDSTLKKVSKNITFLKD